MPAAGFELAFIERIPLPRKPSVDLLKLPVRMRRAILAAKAILREAKADVLVGVGGYVCTPMYLAAKSLGVPIVIHEANTKAGLANQVGARYTTFVGTAFEATKIRHAHLVGMPMRKAVATLDRKASRAAARDRLGLDAELPALIVTGGSLGALRINKAIAASLEALAAAGIQTLHITGKGKSVPGSDGEPLTGPLYRQVEYVDGMEDVYAAADLLLCRSGAGTVSEVAAVGLPAVFVPLPVGNGEQARNAAGLVAAGAALLVSDAELDARWIAENVIPLCLDAPKLALMGESAAVLGIRDAAESMAGMVLAASGN
ncbi:UDP-N-acetylglucosamine-N-acetylmuramylpentapeptide N-acetylglucosamine transferase [Arthrobacter alpinus]|uniref:UDP-N-acetylglucosamine-N-acetylmuramylpentapeptide N-acetylglucosamine transferase n=1 Tax=Arthrobacter alpinus TaxID=656366 RepID=A0A1H5GM24_9MICC|nr:UDP-N-acetylglucosamine-N-acetylmuramylpentapeptide N-acetylglucosamine transferase [Arthrobacter alpinus]